MSLELEKFQNIRFGFASAEKELQEKPDLLTNGLYRQEEFSHLVENSANFLILGSKGCGKTAIAKNFLVRSESNPKLFVHSVDLADFPFTMFSKIITGNLEPEAKLPTAWQWIFFIYLFGLIEQDHGKMISDGPRFEGLMKALKASGLAASENLSDIIKRSRKEKLKLSAFSSSFEYDKEVEDFKDGIPFFLSSFRKTLNSVQTDGKYIIFFDGLDDILTKRKIQYEAVGALIFEANRFNGFLDQISFPAKVVVLCRDDLFDRISGSNKNKIKVDNSIILDWRVGKKRFDESNLFNLVRHRARANGFDDDIFDSFFPKRLGGAHPFLYLMNRTRHRPRDIIQLLNNIQYCSSRVPISQSDIATGVSKYSSDYFIGEMYDELYGFIDTNKANIVFEALGDIRKTFFDLGMLAAKLAESGIDFQETVDICKALFDCGVIFNSRKVGEEIFYHSKEKSSRSSFRREETIVIHRGIQKALNIGK